MHQIGLACLFLITVLVNPAAAYLDPGSGSMLVAGIVGLLASLLFFLKSLYYKIRRTIRALLGKTPLHQIAKHRLVLYSEGRQYWNTFRPLIDELIRRNERCLYLTSDEQDPGLLYASEFVTAQYIGVGTKAYAQLAILEADLCALTTPGLDVLQIKRSKGVSHYAYLMHAPTDIGSYKQYSFDYFDSLLLSGAHQIRSIRKLEQLRGTPQKALLNVGCLYYDAMVRQRETLPTSPKTGAPITVLVAPTWGQNGLLKRLGSRVLIPLLETQWRIVLRPHPQSMTSEKELLVRLREELKHYSNLVWDHEKDGLASMARADAMVSDISGIAFDFAFLFEKPVFTLNYELITLGQEAVDLPWEAWELTALNAIGSRVDEAELSRLPAMIQHELGTRDRTEKIRRLRDESVMNFGCAAKEAAQALLTICQEVPH